MSYSYSYDPANRLINKSASGRTLLSYNYDLNGNLICQEDVTGKVTEYTYNAIDLLEKVTDNGNIVAEYAYNPDGTKKSLSNGSLYTEYQYDTDQNLAGLKTMLCDKLLVDNHYRYDHNGHQIEKQQADGTTRYTYDALNQLSKVEYPSYTEELYYDKAGNRSRRVVGGAEELYQYDPRNRLTEYTKGGMTTKLQYDNGGNLLADGRARYTYDVFNRTEKVETFDGHVQINRYDTEGLRHELEEDGKLVQFIFRGDEIVAEKTDDKIIRLIRGYDLVASDAENAKTYYHYASNELGSITHVVDDRDVLNHYEYDAWGNLAVCEEAVPNRFLFTGQQYDGIIQQYYLRARFYNPAIARFTQEDTYRGDGQNLYTYCRNNPVCYVDPSGHCSKDPDGNQAGSGNNGELLLPAVIPTQPQLPAVIDTPQKQLPAVIDNYQNGISGSEVDTPNNQNRKNSNEGGSDADLTIMSRNSSRGNPSAITHFDVELNTRQENLLQQLPNCDSSIVVNKGNVSLNDLAALTAKTGDEFAMFTRGSQRMIIRGNASAVNINGNMAQELYNAGFKWSGHTHPGVGINVKFASEGDMHILKQFNQTQSVILDSQGNFNIFEIGE